MDYLLNPPGSQSHLRQKTFCFDGGLKSMVGLSVSSGMPNIMKPNRQTNNLLICLRMLPKNLPSPPFNFIDMSWKIGIYGASLFNSS